MPQRHAATRRRGYPSRLGARVISPGPRGTRLYRAGRTFFRQKKIKPTTLHPRHRPATHPTRAPPCPKPPQTKHTPKAPHARRAGTQAPRAPNARGRAHTRARAQKQKKNSAIGTRTRVSWVKAKYDNHRGSETYGFSDLHLCPLSFQEGIAEFLRRSTDVCELRTADFSESWVSEQAIGETRASGQIALRWRIRESSRARTGRRATSNPSCRNRAVAYSHGSARIV